MAQICRVLIQYCLDKGRHSEHNIYDFLLLSYAVLGALGMNGYISTREAAARWNISERQVQKLCGADRIPGVVQFVDRWAIPEDAQKPTRTPKTKPGLKKKIVELL